MGASKGLSGIFRRVLKKATPSSSERQQTSVISEEVLRKLSSAAKDITGSHVQVMLTGSIAKDTYTSGACDMDAFLLFPKHYSIKGMEAETKKIADAAFPKHRKLVAYAEHPYVRVLDYRGFKLDVVPAYKISHSSERMSSVDRTQLHTEFVNKRMSVQQRDQVRLLKQFLKANGLYGAELKVEGFSGYICELMVLKFGSFIKALEAFASGDCSGQLCIGDRLHGEPKQYPGAALVFLDPVDHERNAAAAVSASNLAMFIMLSRRFIERPSISFFGPKPVSASSRELVSKARRRGTFIVGIEFPKPELIDDMLYPQLKKAVNQLYQELELNEFNVFGYAFDADQNHCVILIELLHENLPAVRKCIGPSVVFAKNVKDFIAAHRASESMHVEHFNIVAIEKRKLTSAADLIGSYLIGSYLKKSQKGIPTQLRQPIKQFVFIDLSRLARKYPGLIDRYLNSRFD